ncbi:hypothetical protein [Alteriqipengyuania lutimaris]|uniref:Uncharacterized protein n=1 Tax=Alteriqipengyuania lutimaris TaxID=1538146 RepID=A0A395LR96_9SPHN|nr:hypothetical protein [Alteriqipengyuania lutimaris]MBB3032852.1 hypothetical protein [Alteriqipengyuania lutimaris]RDS78054.1 hypothetical protein DL238_10890 [Alteriqipengyuania lutimaris]
MKLYLRLVAGTAAILALAQPSLAQGTACVEPADLGDAVTYTMPLAMDAVQASCADALPGNSFVLSQGDAFAENFALLRGEAWPGARRFLMAFMENETGGAGEAAGGNSASAIGQMIAGLDGDELRPFVDGIVREMIVQEIKPSTCGDIEKVLPLIAPLPAENFGTLLATMIGVVGENENLNLCPAGK